jgi:hypothetical protein
MRVCSGVPARRGTVGDGMNVHWALRAAGTWGGLWGPVREANELLSAESQGGDTAGDAGAVHAGSLRGLSHGS